MEKAFVKFKGFDIVECLCPFLKSGSFVKQSGQMLSVIYSLYSGSSANLTARYEVPRVGWDWVEMGRSIKSVF